MGGQTTGIVIVEVLGDVHWMREIASFMDGLPGLILAFQRRRVCSGEPTEKEKPSQTVHDAVEAEDLKVLEMLGRLVKQPRYANDFCFEAAGLYACYRQRYTSFRWLEDRGHILRKSSESKSHRQPQELVISHQYEELRVVHDFLVDTLDKSKATSSGFDPSPALSVAVRQGRADLVAMLLEFGWPNGCNVGTALRLAAAGGHFEIVRLLVTKGKWRSLMDATMQASYYNHTEIVDYLKRAHQERLAAARL